MKTRTKATKTAKKQKQQSLKQIDSKTQAMIDILFDSNKESLEEDADHLLRFYALGDDGIGLIDPSTETDILDKKAYGELAAKAAGVFNAKFVAAVSTCWWSNVQDKEFVPGLPPRQQPNRKEMYSFNLIAPSGEVVFTRTQFYGREDGRIAWEPERSNSGWRIEQHLVPPWRNSEPHVAAA